MVWLAATLAAAWALRFGIAVLMPTVHRPDEIFQTLEPAYRILTGHGVITWEWHAGLRSPLYPGVIAALIGVARWLGAGPAGYLGFVTAVFSLLSALTVAVGFDAGWRRDRLRGALLCGTLCATWPDLVYFGPKPLAEIQSGNLLILAAYLASRTPERLQRWNVVLIGLISAMAFCLRIQLAPALLIVALWTCRLQWRRWLQLALGAASPLLALGVSDLVFWHAPFVSILRNVQINLVNGVSEQFGVQPFHWYVSTLLERWGAALVPLGAGFLLGLRRAPLLALVAAAVVLSHTAVSHKEISFIYAALPPLIVVAGLGTLEIIALLALPARRAAVLAVVAGFWLATGVTTALSSGMTSIWLADSGVLRAEQVARRDPALCGLGVRWPQVIWTETGGDVYLGRDIPIYAFGSPAAVTRIQSAINYAIGGANVAEGLPGFTVVGCWPNPGGRVCLARGDRTSCVADPALDINNVPELGMPWTRDGADSRDHATP